MQPRLGILLTISLFVLSMPSLSPAFDRQTVFLQPAQPLTQPDCAVVFMELTKDENWLEQLINPVITTERELAERLDFYRQVYDCIENNHQSLPAEIRQNLDVVRLLLNYFIIFAGGDGTPESATRLVLISLKQSNDPAIVKIRDEAGVSPSEGYIFVRFYASRFVMPYLVGQVFMKEGVAGVTFLVRYVAILEEKKNDFSDQVLQMEVLPETVSHELVHAYVNSALGLKHISLPKWYHEGLAIYFSGSGEEHSVIVSPNQVTTLTSPEEYQQYKTNFEYLEKQYGRKKFLNLIKQSIEQANPSVLYRDLDISDEIVLTARASSWRQQKRLMWVGGLIVLFLILLSPALKLIRFLRELVEKYFPEKRCQYCGYGGRKEEFKFGYCPKCEHRYNIKKLG